MFARHLPVTVIWLFPGSGRLRQSDRGSLLSLPKVRGATGVTAMSAEKTHTSSRIESFVGMDRHAAPTLGIVLILCGLVATMVWAIVLAWRTLILVVALYNFVVG
jgi:hypothetical protein